MVSVDVRDEYRIDLHRRHPELLQAGLHAFAAVD
jgi:hypothetical protein